MLQPCATAPALPWPSAQRDWATHYMTYCDLLAKQRMSIEQARLTKLNATPVVVPATPYRETIRVRK